MLMMYKCWGGIGEERRRPVLEEEVALRCRSGGPKGLQMFKKIGPKKGPNVRNGGRTVAIASTRVGKPQRVQCYGMSSLKLEPKALAKDERIGRP